MSGVSRTIPVVSGFSRTSRPSGFIPTLIAEQYLDALVAKDPTRLSIAGNVTYAENGQRRLTEIETLLERAPYGMTSGWSSWEDGMSDTIQFDK